CAISKPLGQSRKDRAADAKLWRADANPRAIADFVDSIADIQNIEAKFRPLSEAEVELLNDACIDSGIFRQGRAVRHGWGAGTQAALRHEVHRDTGLVFRALIERVGDGPGPRPRLIMVEMNIMLRDIRQFIRPEIELRRVDVSTHGPRVGGIAVDRPRPLIVTYGEY